MDVNKIRNLTDIELAHQQRELSDQLFKMKFQLKMGQTESLKKIRELKKDIARVQTVLRQKELAGGNGLSASASNPVKNEEHTSELQSLRHLVCRLLLEK